MSQIFTYTNKLKPTFIGFLTLFLLTMSLTYLLQACTDQPVSDDNSERGGSGSEVVGRVDDGSNSDTKQKLTANPLALNKLTAGISGAEIYLRKSNYLAESTLTEKPNTTTKSDGSFSITGVAGGIYILEAVYHGKSRSVQVVVPPSGKVNVGTLILTEPASLRTYLPSRLDLKSNPNTLVTFRLLGTRLVSKVKVSQGALTLEGIPLGVLFPAQLVVGDPIKRSFTLPCPSLTAGSQSELEFIW